MDFHWPSAQSAVSPSYADTSSLRARFAASGVDLHIVDPNRAGSYELLSAAYSGLFEKFFPHEVYQEPLSKWHKRLEDENAPSNYVIGISGTNLRSPHTRTLTGIFIGIYYKNADTGLLAYNIVDTPYRSGGIGRLQVETRKALLVDAARAQGKTMRGLFAECSHPAVVDAAHDVMNPRERLKIYAHMQGRRVPVDYTCPSGADICDKLSDMVLLAFPHPVDGRYPLPHDVKSYLRGTYEVRGLTPDGDPDFDRMATELDRLHTMNGHGNGHWLQGLVTRAGNCRSIAAPR